MPVAYPPKIGTPSQGGFTRMELAVVIVVLVVLAALLIPVVQKVRQKSSRLYCINYLMQTGISYRLWANDHHDLFPSHASVTNGGWSELLTKTNAGQYCWTNFAILREQLGESTRIVACPADERKPATNFIVKGTTNDTGNAAFKDNTTVSYFVGVNASDLYPQALLSGDRNLGPGLIPDPNYGYSPTNGKGNDVTLYPNSPVSWSLKMHSHGNPAGSANILLGDGSAQQVSSSTFRSVWMVNASTGTNFSGTNQPGFRLIFP
jgi:Tfp pilus assembly protein PilE